MSSKRLKKIGGALEETSFDKLLGQIANKGILVVVVINTNCEECRSFLEFVNQMEAGFIHKLPQLVLLYGYSNRPVEGDRDPDRRSSGEEGKEAKPKLGDTNLLDWAVIPEGHGYAIYTNKEEKAIYKGAFNHEEFKQNISDALRRFKSSIKTLAGLPGKREFLEKKGSGIIIETSTITKPEEISEVEAKVKGYGDKIKVPVYFCKGISQEISYVRAGQVVEKVKGLNFDKIVKKIGK